MMLMRQVELSIGERKMVTWVDDHPKLCKGNFLRLKDGTDLWKIDEVHGVLEKKEINRTWHVGGL